MSAPNPARGEGALTVAGAMLTVRPSFAALIAAEQELGPLFALVERAAAGRLTLAETVALVCLAERPAGLDRDALGEAVVEAGLAALTPLVRTLLQQVLKGR